VCDPKRPKRRYDGRVHPDADRQKDNAKVVDINKIIDHGP
jgi:hypothetical protein